MPDLVLLLARVLLGAVFLRSGYFKLLAPAATIAHSGFPVPAAAYVLTICVELAGGAAVLLGYRTRWAAGALAVYCLLTALRFHIHLSALGELVRSWETLAIAGGFLQLAATGPGRFSLSRG
jgi:putative oxidoreductase